MRYVDQYKPDQLTDTVGASLSDLPGMKPIGRLRAMMILASGRSWWEAQYASGKTVAEWDTLQGSIFTPMGNPATSRWEEIEKHSLAALRLLCPNGKAGELRSTGSYCLFQLKSGSIAVPAGPIGIAGRLGDLIAPEQHCRYHVIGAVTDTNGSCDCYAWDYQGKRLLKFQDNVQHMAFNGIGPLNLGEAVGVK